MLLFAPPPHVRDARWRALWSLIASFALNQRRATVCPCCVCRLIDEEEEEEDAEAAAAAAAVGAATGGNGKVLWLESW